MNTAAKGRKNEWRSRALFELAGYRMIRAAGSKGEWDLIGISKTDFVLCQVKTRDWPGAVEMETLREYPCPANTRKLVHRWVRGASKPDVREL